jgi:hypothetical protein
VLEQKRQSRTRAVEAIKAGLPPQGILAAEKARLATEAATGNPAAPGGDTGGGQAPGSVIDFRDYFK